MTIYTPAKLVLIEDSPDDEQMTLRGLRGCPEPIMVRVARDGANALRVLGLGTPNDRENLPTPDLVITDLKLPGVHGDELVRMARADVRLSKVPFVVFSSSNELRDIERCSRFGAKAYAQKPMNPDNYMLCARDVARWALQGFDPNKTPPYVIDLAEKFPFSA